MIRRVSQIGLALLLLCSLCLASLPEEHLNVTQIIQYNGYPCIEHEVMTADGFVLGVQQIPTKNGSSASRGAVILMHGVFDSSATWVLNGREKSLAFNLADAGYTVYLGNSRGNVRTFHFLFFLLFSDGVYHSSD